MFFEVRGILYIREILWLVELRLRLLNERVKGAWQKTALLKKWKCHVNNKVIMRCEALRDVIMGTMASQITSLTTVYSTFYSGGRSKKTSKLRVTGLCAGNSPGTGEFPAQMASNAENVSIRWRHHDKICTWLCGVLICCDCINRSLESTCPSISHDIQGYVTDTGSNICRWGNPDGYW